MKIIETKTAPDARRVRIFLEEKGISVPFEQRDLMAGELKAMDFTAINPFQRVPVLVLDDGTKISDSVAIGRYFEEIQPDLSLFGAGQSERPLWRCCSAVRSWACGLISHRLFAICIPRWRIWRCPQAAPWIEANKAKVVGMIGLLDRQMGEHRFVAGEILSIAVITTLVAIDILKPAKTALSEGLQRQKRWHGEVSARPSAAA